MSVMLKSVKKKLVRELKRLRTSERSKNSAQRHYCCRCCRCY